MKKLLLSSATMALGIVAMADFTAAFRAVSPDSRNVIELTGTGPLAYRVRSGDCTLVDWTRISMTVDGTELAAFPDGAQAKAMKVGDLKLPTPVYKKSFINLGRNDTFVDCGSWGVRLAARNDGVAYRFETMMSGVIGIDGESAGVTLPQSEVTAWYYPGKSIGCEECCAVKCDAKDIGAKGSHIYMPLVYTCQGKTVAISDADVYDYPIWNLKKGEGTLLKSLFAGWPRRIHRAGGFARADSYDMPGRWEIVDEEEKFLVQTDGTRTFPWRTFVIADEPSKLCQADIVNVLSRKAAPDSDFSWVVPGKVAWDWWNSFDNQGNEGCNTKTYLRFIDFAARTGVKYVILDEGWSESLNIWKYHPDVYVPQIIEYAREKGVGIILWMAWGQVVGNEEKVASHFAQLGARGFKVDFMDRGDAEMENFLWRFADACARNRMLVDYHGAHRPTGMSMAYPNVLNYEGIFGLETMKFYGGSDAILHNDVASFFMRMTAGPMDYTPGAMDNYAFGKYPGRDVTRTDPGSLGTRARQVAMMIAYEAPLQMLCDSPTKYERNMECFSFMAAVPEVWQNTIGIGGSPDTYCAVARKAKDGTWYAAALTDSSARDIKIDTRFLEKGTWAAEIFRDADDSNVNARNYVHEIRSINAGEVLQFHLANGGGVAIRFLSR